jgi:hypothetical protein
VVVAALGIAMVILGLRIGLLIGASRYAAEIDVATTEAATRTAPWASHLRTVEQALAQGNVSLAVHAWRDAHAAAAASRRWEGALAVGDAYIRIGEAGDFRARAEMTARRSYLAALLQARRDRSVEGVLKAGAAFHALGDRRVVDQAAHIASTLDADLTTAAARERIVWLAPPADGRRRADASSSLRF